MYGRKSALARPASRTSWGLAEFSHIRTRAYKDKELSRISVLCLGNASFTGISTSSVPIVEYVMGTVSLIIQPNKSWKAPKSTMNFLFYMQSLTVLGYCSSGKSIHMYVKYYPASYEMICGRTESDVPSVKDVADLR